MLVLYVACERWKSRLWLSARGRARGLHEVPPGPRITFCRRVNFVMEADAAERVNFVNCDGGSDGGGALTMDVTPARPLRFADKGVPTAESCLIREAPGTPSAPPCSPPGSIRWL